VHGTQYKSICRTVIRDKELNLNKQVAEYRISILFQYFVYILDQIQYFLKVLKTDFTRQHRVGARYVLQYSVDMCKFKRRKKMKAECSRLIPRKRTENLVLLTDRKSLLKFFRSFEFTKSDQRGWLTSWPPRSFANPIWHGAPLCLHWSTIVPLCFHLL